MDRLADSAKWLAAEVSCERHEFYQAHKEGAAMLFEGLHAQGYARTRNGRTGLTDAGIRYVQDERPIQEPVEG